MILESWNFSAWSGQGVTPILRPSWVITSKFPHTASFRIWCLCITYPRYRKRSQSLAIIRQVGCGLSLPNCRYRENKFSCVVKQTSIRYDQTVTQGEKMYNMFCKLQHNISSCLFKKKYIKKNTKKNKECFLLEIDKKQLFGQNRIWNCDLRMTLSCTLLT